MRRSLAALCGRFHGSVRKLKKLKSRLLVSLNCSKRAEFIDDSAVSLATSGSKSLHYTFYSGKFTLPSLTIVT